GGDLGFEFGLGMEFCGHNPDDGDGDERTADGECDEGLLHEVSFSDHGDRVTHDPSGAGTLGPRPIGRSGSADPAAHTGAARLFASSAGPSPSPVDGVTAPESGGSSVAVCRQSSVGNGGGSEKKPRIRVGSGALTGGDGGNRTRVRRQIVGTSPGAVREAVS